MGSLTTDIEQRFLRWALVDSTSVRLSPVQPIYARLMASNGDASNPGVEVTGDLYDQVFVSWGQDATSPGVEFTNGNSVHFPGISSTSTVSVNGVEFWDSSLTPIRIAFATFTSPVNVAAGTPVNISAGQIKIHVT